ncbi:MAG: hypothetical protein ABIJ45_00600, partial [Candidatus Zixiibacteriota bacterium]
MDCNIPIAVQSLSRSINQFLLHALKNSRQGSKWIPTTIGNLKDWNKIADSNNKMKNVQLLNIVWDLTALLLRTLLMNLIAKEVMDNA